MAKAKLPDFGTRTLVLRRRHNWKLFAAVGGVLAVVILAYLLSEVFAPLMLALLLAYILNPCVAWLEKRGLTRGRAVNALFLVLGLVLAAVIAFGVPLSVQQVVDWTWAFQGEYIDTPTKGEVLQGDWRRVDRPEPYVDTNSDGAYTPPEAFSDLNGNGVYDPPETWTDANGDGVVDPGEFSDHNKNGVYDPAEPWDDVNGDGIVDGGEFSDLNGNGVFDAPETFDDANGNGLYDGGDSFEDLNTNGVRDLVLYYVDRNGNGSPDVGYIDRARKAARDERHWFGSMVGRLSSWRGRKEGKQLIDGLLNRAKANMSELAAKSSRYASQGLRAVFTTLSKLLYLLMAIILVPIYTYFFLHGLNDIRDTGISYIPSNVRAEVVHLLQQIHEVSSAFFRGRLLICIVMGLVSMTGFMLCGLPFSLIFGLMMMVAGLVPFLPVVVMVPAVLVAVVDLSWWGVAGVVLAGVVGQGLDWPLTTMIQGKQLKLHPITVVIALLVFGKLLGFVGLLLAIPIVASLKVLGRELVLPQLKELADGPPVSAGLKPAGDDES